MRHVTAPMGFVGELNCKSGYEKGRRVSVPYPEEGTAQAACSDKRAEPRKASKAKNRSIELLQKTR